MPQCGGEQPAWNQSFGLKCSTAWCGVFVGMALDQAGFVVDRGEIPSTEQIYADAQSGLNGLSTIPKEAAQRGDLILFNYVGPPRKVSHVGLVTGAGGGGSARSRATRTPRRWSRRTNTGSTTGASSRSCG